MDIYKDFRIEAAHYLPRLPEEHPCRRLHGHSFQIRVQVRGEVKPDQGWVMDFAEISEAFEPLRQELDHRCLNDIPGLENPTSEMLAQWLWEKLKPVLPDLHQIEIKETCTSGCIFQGPS